MECHVRSRVKKWPTFAGRLYKGSRSQARGCGHLGRWRALGNTANEGREPPRGDRGETIRRFRGSIFFKKRAISQKPRSSEETQEETGSRTMAPLLACREKLRRESGSRAVRGPPGTQTVCGFALSGPQKLLWARRPRHRWRLRGPGKKVWLEWSRKIPWHGSCLPDAKQLGKMWSLWKKQTNKQKNKCRPFSSKVIFWQWRTNNWLIYLFFFSSLDSFSKTLVRIVILGIIGRGEQAWPFILFKAYYMQASSDVGFAPYLLVLKMYKIRLLKCKTLMGHMEESYQEFSRKTVCQPDFTCLNWGPPSAFKIVVEPVVINGRLRLMQCIQGQILLFK